MLRRIAPRVIVAIGNHRSMTAATAAAAAAVRPPPMRFREMRMSAAKCKSFSNSSPRSEEKSSGEKKEMMNFFDILGIERSFSVSQEEAKSAYRSLMSTVHPDMHHSSSTSSAEGEMTDDGDVHSPASASDVTRAYDVIRRPHSRASHLLKLVGLSVDENDTGELVGNSFLASIMDIREAVHGASSEDELRLLLRENESRVEETCEGLSEAFGRGDYDAARRLTAQLRYWDRIGEELREKTTEVD